MNKKPARILMVVMALCLVSPAVASSHTDPVIATRITELENRLHEIETIDRTALSKEERKALRHEVKEIKKELQGISGGVYLSIGAIILIALLLILLL
jgi:predicted GTPase